MADLTTLQSDLIDAEAAYKKLMLGSQEVHVQHGDMVIGYTRGKVGDLKAWIDTLKGQIIAAGGTLDTLPRKSMVIDL